MKFKFYDTCSLLLKADNLWDEDYKLVVSSITLEELENIKTSIHKDPDVKFAARKIIHELDENIDKYYYMPWHETDLLDFPPSKLFSLTNDLKIISCVYKFIVTHPADQVIFVTNDICCKQIARHSLSIPIESYQEDDYDYDVKL